METTRLTTRERALLGELDRFLQQLIDDGAELRINGKTVIMGRPDGPQYTMSGLRDAMADAGGDVVVDDANTMVIAWRDE